MRNRWVRTVFLGLILTFPMMIFVASARSLTRAARELGSSTTVIAVELMLVGGMIFAVRERRRLLGDLAQAQSRSTWVVAHPSTAVTGPKLAFKTSKVRTTANR
jgi:hypothetical protein